MRRVVVIILGVALALPTLAWTATFLYWHLRITTALKGWEKSAKVTRDLTKSYGISVRDYQSLRAAGCRSLPYLVTALEDSRNPEFQEGLMVQILSTLGGPGPYTEEQWALWKERSLHWSFEASNLEFQRERAIGEFRTWWRDHGRNCHQWWRVWSPWCGGDQP